MFNKAKGRVYLKPLVSCRGGYSNFLSKKSDVKVCR